MERRKADILCVKGSKARRFRDGIDRKRKRVAVIPKEQVVRSGLDVTRASDRLEAGNRRSDAECCECIYPKSWMPGGTERAILEVSWMK